MKNKAIVFCLLLGACASQGGVARQACYAKADTTLWAGAEERCIDAGWPWETCPERRSLLEEHMAAQGRCP